MKKIILSVAIITVLVMTMIILSGCTLQIETTENSVSASVDGDTTERVDSVIDWIRERISRVFTTSDNKDSQKDTQTKVNI